MPASAGMTNNEAVGFCSIYNDLGKTFALAVARLVLAAGQ
jgi:hypothetical protein